MKSLCIISHTEHYRLADGTIVGLGSTVTEINQLLRIFDNIIHVAMLHNVFAPPSALPYISDKISFVKLPEVGGKTFFDKMNVIFQSPKILVTVRKAIKETDYFQFRAPTGIGVYVIPYLLFFVSQKGWFKFAGNWKQTHAPYTYRFQKWLLEHQSRPVTINGFWTDQPNQCLSFENPCLTEYEIKFGQTIKASKNLQFPIQLCFVGRLEAAKGLDLIIETLTNLDTESLQKIKIVHIVGAGSQIKYYQKLAKIKALPFVFYGYLSRAAVHQIYTKSHAIILPSASEGFPKVIAEAINYGCIPIVSDVSSISQYIKNNVNGFLIEFLTMERITKILLKFLNLSEAEYSNLRQSSIMEIQKFSYTYYNQRILADILKKFDTIQE